MLLNWGSVDIPSGNNRPTPSTFSLSYTSACFQVVSDTDLSSGQGMKNIGATSMSLTQITWTSTYTYSSVRTGTQRWLAIGI